MQIPVTLVGGVPAAEKFLWQITGSVSPLRPEMEVELPPLQQLSSWTRNLVSNHLRDGSLNCCVPQTLPSQVGLEQGTCFSSSEGCGCPKQGSSFLTSMPAVKKAQSSSHLKACMWQVWIISQKKPKLISNQLESSYSTILWVCCSDPIISCLINPQGHRTKSEQPGHLHEAHTCPEGAGYLNQSIVSADLK